MANNPPYVLIWSRQVRGLTIAEKAVLGVLASFMDRVTGKCRVQMGHLVWRLEASRVYLRQVVHKLAKKGFITIEEQFDARGLQEANNIKLHTDRCFPRDNPGYQLGMRILNSHIRDLTYDSRMRTGFLEAWVQELPKRHSKRAKPILFIAVNSPDHYALIESEADALTRKLVQVPPYRHYKITPVRMFDDRRVVE